MSTGQLAHRLYIQAVFSALFPVLFLDRDGSTWLLIGLVLAAASAGLALWVGKGDSSTRNAVIGFEAAALAVGGLGLMGGHYVPGSIIGAWTLVHVVMHGASEAAAMPAAPTAPVAPVEAMQPNFGASVPSTVTGVAPEPAVPVMAMAATAPQTMPAAPIVAAPIETAPAPAAPIDAAPAPAAPMPAPAASLPPAVPLSRDILPGR
ncbi:MAG: hypothetical protein ACJ735_17740 [Actinomycetes bacterium]